MAIAKFRDVAISMLHMSSQIVHRNSQTFQIGDMFCVAERDGGLVYKYPIARIFRVVEHINNTNQVQDNYDYDEEE